MNQNKILLILLGTVVTLIFLEFYLGFNSPLYLFGITLGIMTIIFGFYTENKKIKVSISYLVAALSINIVQWLILVYIFYYNSVYLKLDFYIFLIGTLGITLSLFNQIYKKYIKSPENIKKTKIGMSDKKKLIILSAGVILIIVGLAGLIFYYSPIFLYLITLGLMGFVYGNYYECKKVNVSVNYARAISFLLILQWIILFYFLYQFSPYDWYIAFMISANITLYFSIQIYRRNFKISNEKKDMVIGIGALILFIAIFGALAIK